MLLSKRSGITREVFIELLSWQFDGFYILDKNGYRYYDIFEAGEFFDKEDNPERGTKLVLCNKSEAS